MVAENIEKSGNFEFKVDIDSGWFAWSGFALTNPEKNRIAGYATLS